MPNPQEQPVTTVNQKNYSTEVPPLENPFDNIALAFSGGGFRAASFALGVMSYLGQLPSGKKTLLENVTYLSSASGGTIATALYSLYSTREGKTHPENFKDFYIKLYTETEEVKLLDRVFQILNSDSEWKNRKNKRRNIINAFALAYDTILFDQKRVEDVKNKNSASSIQEVCFNATEFYRGLLFRQSIKLKPDSKNDLDTSFLYGNYIVHLPHEVAAKFKLADLLAASSCFPAGFEPIIFPDDFLDESIKKITLSNTVEIEPQELDKDELELLFGKETVKQLIASLPQSPSTDDLLARLKKLPLSENFKFGLMDGGITDNQGLESMIRANERRLKGETSFKPFDFMLVNDVGSHYMNPYQLGKNNKTYSGISGITLGTVTRLSAILTVAGIAGLVLGVSCLGPEWFSKLIIFVCTAIFLLSGTLFGLILTIRKFIRGKLSSGGGLDLEDNFSPGIVKKMFSYFGKTPVGLIKRMVTERINSVMIMNSSVFLKRIRQLLYQRFFEAGKLENRVKSNHIYDLAFTNDRNRADNDSKKHEPSREMQIVAEAAFRMSTTLWFDGKQQDESVQESIIACGQFTTCYNLLEYINRLKNGKLVFNDASLDRIETLEKILEDHYNHFKTDPYWLLNKLGNDFKITGWKDQKVKSTHLPKGFEGLR
jgi:hypothetical protein